MKKFFAMLGAFFAAALAMAPPAAANPVIYNTISVDLLFASTSPTNAPAVAIQQRSGSVYYIAGSMAHDVILSNISTSASRASLDRDNPRASSIVGLSTMSFDSTSGAHAHNDGSGALLA